MSISSGNKPQPLTYEEFRKIARAPLPAIRTVSTTPKGNSQAPRWAKELQDWEDREPSQPFDQ